MRFSKFLKKSGNGSKIWGNGPKIWGNRSTKWDLKVFEKSGNGSKIWGNGPKIWGNRPTNMRKLIKKKRKPFNSKYWETDTKHSEIP